MTDTPTQVSGANDNVHPESEGDTAAALLESQLTEHSKIQKMSKFLRRGDELENALADVVSNMLCILPTAEATEFSHGDVVDIIYGLPPVETINMTEFFARPALHCRLLRRVLELHLVKPIKTEDMNTITTLDDERGDPRLAEQVWFLLFLGAPPDNIGETSCNSVIIDQTSRLIMFTANRKTTLLMHARINPRTLILVKIPEM